MINLELVLDHPRSDVRDASSDQFQFFSHGNKIEFAIYLCVISINMVINVVVIKNRAESDGVNAELYWAENRFLWDSIL